MTTGKRRFPLKAYYRRLDEARGLPSSTLVTWLRSRTKAKRYAAQAELGHRTDRGD